MWKVAGPLPPKTSKLKESALETMALRAVWGDTDE